MSRTDVLDRFLPPVGIWFRRTLGSPTPPQVQGWPIIAEHRHCLILAPTGSGKTLAAFLAALDHLWRTPGAAHGTRILYISPLKALNADIARNLEDPLQGITAIAQGLDAPLPVLSVGVRTGDTPTSDRQRWLRHPPQILITTPESLHLLLTSKARETLRYLDFVIVDEIHALSPNKRGVFLSLLLERLETEQKGDGFARIGLSATQRPLDEVARFLGGRRKIGPGRFEQRPVVIVDAGQRKQMDLAVELPNTSPVLPVPGAPARSVWPGIEARLLAAIQEHRSTIVFTRNRRVAERLTHHLNQAAARDQPERAQAADGGTGEPRDLVQAHHGSLSPAQRRETEEALKAGTLRGVVATASLELGIDMGAVELVCQVESPGSVSRGLQRVGRAGHVVGGSSKGVLLAKTPSDLLEAAALAQAMSEGAVEALRVPQNCLDVLAQQVVACVAIEPIGVSALYDLVRSAYPYRALSPAAFESVLELVSGRFALEAFRDLKPRVSWDRVHNQLRALPGTRHLALTSGGTIPDTGQFPVYLGDGGPRLGELDEEFVLERRVGETFLLGTAAWRIDLIEPHRVLVSPAQGQAALTPFWRGEQSFRSPELAQRVGQLCRDLTTRLDDSDAVGWLAETYHLEKASAQHLRDYVARQRNLAGVVPDDRTVLVETFRDPAGELGLAVLTTLGGRLHHALKLVLQAILKRRLGISVAALHADDGILFRLPGMDDPPRGLLAGIDPAVAEADLRAELADSALFGLRFRQNAGRALLLPRPDPSKRTPLWLQRLRAKDLLQAVRQMTDFPIVAETYRECLDEDLDLPGLRAFLASLADGSIQVVERAGAIASPFTSSLIFAFSARFLYEWDEPRPVAGKEPTAVSAERIEDLLAEPGTAAWLDPIAIGQTERRLRTGLKPPRSPDELAERLRQLGDLSQDELAGPAGAFLDQLVDQGRAVAIDLEPTAAPRRFILAEEAPLFAAAFPSPTSPLAHAETAPQREAIARIVRRYLQTRALVGLDDLLSRFPIDPATAGELLEQWVDSGQVVRLESTDDAPSSWADRRNLEDVRRLSIALRRREAVAVTPEVFADYLLRIHHLADSERREGPAALEAVLAQLRGFAATPELWEREILPRRLRDLRSDSLDQVVGQGGWYWRAMGEPAASAPLSVAFAPRGFPGRWPDSDDAREPGLDAQRVHEALGSAGASFAVDLSRMLAQEPSRTRAALLELMRLGRVTNDRCDPLRPGAQAMAQALAAAQRPAPSSSRRGRRPISSHRRRATMTPEGRWSLLADAHGDDQESLMAWAAALLDRYAVLCRETAAHDPWAPPWRLLYPVLQHAELRGELRRGYFVEGLSGLQYAWPDTVEPLARLGAGPLSAHPILLSSLDPANLYGSGAPFDLPLLEGGTARFLRNMGNHLVLLAGRPVLLIEGQGRRLTGLGGTSESDLKAALALLSSLTGPGRRVLKVETYNLAPALASPAAPWLAELGFVRDHPGMAYYAGWS